jgi:Family of unknown function (DUF6523)
MAAKGFGKKDVPERPMPSEGSKARDAAGARLERMREGNAPEYSVWLRIVDAGVAAEEEGSPEFPWLPVGSLCVLRNASVAKAIYTDDVYKDLMRGARKMFPQLKRYEDDDIQVGYLPKNSANDDDISNMVIAKRENDSLLSKLSGSFGSLFKKAL